MIYFISDSHLGFFERAKDKQREDLLLQLLEKIRGDAEKIYLVGDIFDFWFEYKTVIPKYFYRTLTALHNIAHSGIETEFLMGNHDFGHRDFFENELNIRVHSGDIEREHYGKKFYISHGDGKSDNDTGYKILKKIMRHPLSLKLYLTLHPDFGIGLASNSSKGSRKYTDKKDYGENDSMREYAKSIIDKGYDYVIMGHRHKAEITQYKNGKYVNIGEWFINPTFARFNTKDMELLNVKEYLSI